MTTSKTDLEGSIQEHDEQIDKKVTQEGQNTKDYVRKVLTNTSFKYLGTSFLLTYHYILWFIPDSFFGTELLNDQVTEAWLVNLLAGSITMLFTAFAIKRGTHLSDNKNLAYGIPVGLALCSVTLQYLPGFLPTNLSMYVLACVAGGLEGLMLILWGECLTRMHAQFSMPHIGMVFSGTLFVLVLISLALPTVLVPMLTAALVVVSWNAARIRGKTRNARFSRFAAKKHHEASTKQCNCNLLHWFLGQCRLLLLGSNHPLGKSPLGTKLLCCRRNNYGCLLLCRLSSDKLPQTAVRYHQDIPVVLGTHHSCFLPFYSRRNVQHPGILDEPSYFLCA